MTHCEGGVFPPAEDDPDNPSEALFAVLEDGILPEGSFRQGCAAGPCQTIPSFL